MVAVLAEGAEAGAEVAEAAEAAQVSHREWLFEWKIVKLHNNYTNCAVNTPSNPQAW